MNVLIRPFNGKFGISQCTLMSTVLIASILFVFTVNAKAGTGNLVFPGCMDPAACNFDPDATTDDSSCTYATLWFADVDGDGFGNSSNSTSACDQPLGFVAVGGDCNDNSISINPGAPELCNGSDDNCNSLIDENCSSTPVLGDYRSAGSGAWSNPATWEQFDGADWQPAVSVPGSTNIVTILSGDSVNMDDAGSALRLTIDTGAIFNVNNGIFFIGNGAGFDLIVNGTLLSSNTIYGSGTVLINGFCNWSAGTFSVAPTVSTSGLLEISGAGSKTLQAILTIHGICNRTGSGAINFNSGRIFVHGELNQNTDADFIFISGINFFQIFPGGTFTKTGGTGNITTTVQWFNQGVMNIESGGFTFSSTSSSAGDVMSIINLPDGGNLTATHGYGNSGTINGSNVTISNIGSGLWTQGYDWNIPTDITFNTSKTIIGSGSITVNGVMNWTGGAINNNVTIAADGVLNISGVLLKTLTNNKTLIIHGTCNWTGGDVALMTASINNQGLLIHNDVGNRFFAGSGTHSFINSGIFEKKNATSSFSISVPTINSGTVKGVGTLSFTGTFNNTGTINPGSSPGILILNGTQPLSGSSNLTIEMQENIQPGVGFDQLHRDGNLILNGTLTVLETGTFPEGTYTIIELTSGTISGSFSSLNLPAGYTIAVNSNNVQLVKSALLNDYRSADNGTWSDAVTWERFDGTDWVAADSPPSSADGIILIRSGHEVNVASAVSVDQLFVEENGVLSISSDLSVEDAVGVDVFVSGTLILESGSISGAGSLNISGSMTWESGVLQSELAILDGASFSKTTSGVATIHDGSILNHSQMDWADGNIGMQDGSIHLLSASASFNISGNNSMADNGGTNLFTNFGSIVKLSDTGTTTIEIPFENYGVLEGFGIFEFAGTLLNEGSVSPGASVGQLSINGTQPLSEESNLEIQILDTTGPGIGNDLLSRDGSLILAGTLTVSELAVAPNATYTIIEVTSGSISGDFDAVELPVDYELIVNPTSIQVKKDTLFGDYRSIASGDWFDPGIWERNDGTGWVPAPSHPSASDGAVTIRTGHNVVADDVASAFQLLIEVGASFTAMSGQFFIGNGPGHDFVVNGTFIHQTTLSGTGTALINGQMDWMSGSTDINLTIAASGLASINGSTNKTINSSTLTNHGEVIWNAGGISFTNSSTFSNHGAFQILGNDAMFNSSGTNLFHNTASGVVTKSVATGTSTVFISTTNQGVITVNSGTIGLQQTIIHSGISNITGTATLKFSGTCSHTGTINISDSGTFHNEVTMNDNGNFNITSGTVLNTNTWNSLIDRVFNANTVFTNSGNLSGSGSISIDGIMNWTCCTISTNVTINPGAILNIIGSGTKTINSSKTLLNQGVCNWSNGDLFLNGATVNNQAEFYQNASVSLFVSSFGGVNLFSNAGTFTKQNSSSLLGFSIPFNNSGTLKGVGTISQSSFVNTGIIEPGTSPGILRMDGAQPLSALSTLSIELHDDSGPGNGHDQLTRNSNLTLSGALLVEETGTIPVGVYTIIDLLSGSISGSFSSVSLPAGYSLIVNPTNVQVEKSDLLQFWADADGDGFGNPDADTLAVSQPFGYVDNDEDCDDTSDAVFPGATEICDDLDNDCDGAVDNNPVDLLTWFQDLDADGFGNSSVTQLACAQPLTFVSVGGDCDDTDENVRPGASELCDGVDNDCDGTTDDDAVDASLWFQDLDGDGFGNSSVTQLACAQPLMFVSVGGDCDDTDENVRPGATELCDNVDNDCDGTTDDDAVDASLWFQDLDGDGFGNSSVTQLACAQPLTFVSVGGDCDDTDENVRPGASELCDGVDNDCDGTTDDDAVDASLWFQDLDGDNFGNSSVSVLSCSPPLQFVSEGGDCDDANSDIFPGAAEFCNGVDDDCDGTIDNSPIDASVYFEDLDGDGFGNSSVSQIVCVQPIGFVLVGGDCDDTNENIFPGATELCDNIDNDCDGLLDNGVAGSSVWYEDADGDGFGNFSSIQIACNQPIGYVSNSSDCNDSDDNSYPGAPEICDFQDNDCDGMIDENPSVGPIWFIDFDGDGFGNSGVSQIACNQPFGFVAVGNDCDDSDNSIYPGADELCDNKDNDCDGQVDEDAINPSTWFEDLDSDGFGNSSVTVLACSPPSGFVSLGGDCDDTNDTVYPGATELCDALDNDCDGAVDESQPLWFADSDGDGFGNSAFTQFACTQPVGFVSIGGDCDDGDNSIFPGAPEPCDATDNDCDGFIDENAIVWYQDLDGDGYGNNLISITDCDQPNGFVPEGGDCDDTNENINPGADDVCDNIDNNCNSEIDEVLLEWYEDSDQDGFGTTNSIIFSCEQPEGYVALSGDCDDSNSDVFPGATETCNGLDDNCDGSTDNGAADATIWFQDLDGDGFGNSSITQLACAQPEAFVSVGGDCDDTNENVNPGATEVCDGLDNDCDTFSDNNPVDASTWFEDLDSDGFGNTSVTVLACSPPVGFVSVGGDCDDTNENVHPGATEFCDGLDNDCDSEVDEGASNQFTWYEDADGDSFGNSSVSQLSCSQPFGYVLIPGDCDDSNENIFPGATEVCDNQDNDCDGIVDESGANAATWFQDADGDGFGNSSVTALACNQPVGFVSISGDCDDDDENIFPGATEFCNGIDDDCDGAVDDDAIDGTTWFFDFDGDSFGNSSLSLVSCLQPVGYVAVGGDCDDTNNAVNPGALEVCDGLDNDCDGAVDEESVTGCTDPLACNFNPLAGCDDGSCEYTSCLDCELVLSSSSTMATLGFANGSANAIVSGGTEPYSYQWNDPFEQTTATALGLFPGTYSCVVTDAVGCQDSIQVSVFLNVGIPFTKVRNQFCNTGGYTLSQVISCDPVQGASNYRWEFKPVGGSAALPEYSRGSSNYNLRLSWISGIQQGVTYEVRVKAFVGGQWGSYGLICTIGVGSSVQSTQLLAGYSPFSPTTGLPYAFCDNLRAQTVDLADRFEWELTGPSSLLAESPSYFIQVGSIPGVQLDNVYNVRVRARVNGIWGEFGVSLPVQLGLPANTSIWVSHCNTVRATNSNVAAYNVCSATAYTFRFQHGSEPERIVVRPGYVCPFNAVVPALTPGETYTVSVKVTQGAIEGDYSTSCPITIAGPGAEGIADDVAVTRVMESGNLGIYPNPNAGTEVRVDLNGIADGYHDVAVTIFDIFGKLMTRDVFGHQGADLSRLVRFEQELATGMYLVQVTIDGETFATEKMIVK